MFGGCPSCIKSNMFFFPVADRDLHTKVNLQSVFLKSWERWGFSGCSVAYLLPIFAGVHFVLENCKTTTWINGANIIAK